MTKYISYEFEIEKQFRTETELEAFRKKFNELKERIQKEFKGCLIEETMKVRR